MSSKGAAAAFASPTAGIHHVGLAVADLEATVAFFTDCLAWSVVRDVPEYPARFVSDGTHLVTLWQSAGGAAQFDRQRQIGLHHLAIAVRTQNDLLRLYQNAAQHMGVVVEFSPELLRGGPAMHCMLYEPGGIRIELIWVP